MSGVRILIYQKIGVAPKNSALKNEWTSLRTLTRTLDKIKSRGLTTVSPAQLLSGNVPGNAILLLFLDGYRSFYTEVYPLLQARQLAACVCLPTACVGTYNSWQNPHREFWQDVLTQNELKKLAKDPLVSFGAQALNREDISLLPDEQARYLAEESVFRLGKLLPAAPELFAVFPAQKKVKNADDFLPGFNGLIVTPDGVLNKLPRTVSIMRGNSYRARWM